MRFLGNLALAIILSITALACAGCGGGGGGGSIGDIFGPDFDPEDALFALFDDESLQAFEANTLDDEDAPPPSGTGDDPVDILVSEETGLTYVANSGEDTVSVYETAALDFQFLIATGAQPVALAYNNDLDVLYVVTQDDDLVEAYDALDGDFLFEEDTGPTPTDVVWHDFTNRVFVCCAGDDTVWVYDHADLNVIAADDIDDLGAENPVAMAADGPRNLLFIACRDTNNVVVCDMAGFTWGPLLAVGDAPAGVAANSTLNRVFVSNSGDDTVSVFRPSDLTELAASPVATGGDMPTSIAIHQGFGLAYIVNRVDETVTVLEAGDLDEWGFGEYFLDDNPVAVAVEQ